jgi:hypothetical protein
MIVGGYRRVSDDPVEVSTGTSRPRVVPTTLEVADLPPSVTDLTVAPAGKVFSKYELRVPVMLLAARRPTKDSEPRRAHNGSVKRAKPAFARCS